MENVATKKYLGSSFALRPRVFALFPTSRFHHKHFPCDTIPERLPNGMYSFTAFDPTHQSYAPVTIATRLEVAFYNPQCQGEAKASQTAPVVDEAQMPVSFSHGVCVQRLTARLLSFLGDRCKSKKIKCSFDSGSLQRQAMAKDSMKWGKY